MITKFYVDEIGNYLGGFAGVEPPVGSIEIPSAPADARQIWDFVNAQWGETPAPPPIDAEPVRIACALRIPVENEEVQTVSGSYRIAAMMLLDTGTFLAIFSQNLGPDTPFVIPINGISVSIAEWGEEYATIEVRDHAGGSLITPSSFGFSLYKI